MMKGLMSGIAGAVLGMGCTSAETVSQAQTWVQEGAVLLDVRTPSEYSDGHITGSVNIPVGELSRRVDEVSGDRVVVYCKSGGRSAAAAQLLTQRGKQVVDLGAMTSWPNPDDIVVD